MNSFSKKQFILLVLAPLVLGCTKTTVLQEGDEHFLETVIPVEGISFFNGFPSQGLAMCDDYAFITYDTGLIQVLDYNTKMVISSYAMPTGVHHVNNHAGIAVFGNLYYDESDAFPLLYISSYKESKCYVLRVTLTGSELVQEIQMEKSWHFFVDEMNLIVRQNDNIYYVFNLPDINQKNVVLNKSDAKKKFLFDLPRMNYAGAICSNGRMYVLCYYTETPFGVIGKYDRLVEYDYYEEKIVSHFIFHDLRIRTNEFEGLTLSSSGEMVISFIHDQLAIISYKNG